MMGARSPQEKLFAAGHVYLDFVGRETLYGYLAQNRQHLFRDEDFAALYCANNGRTSVPPSVVISILFLRAYEGVSFVEAIDRTKYDLRWKVALGLEMEEAPLQKSALQEFEAKLVIHELGEALLNKSIDEARRAGYLKSRKIRVALDTAPILGKGTVKDTYNLLAEGIVQLACRLAPLVRAVLCGRNVGVGKGRALSAPKPKKLCSNRPGPITKPGRDGRVDGNEWWWSIASRGWCN
jgi:hypothetical protein